MKNFKINSISIDELLNLYQQHRFLYPEKLEKLLPVMPLIKENLNKAFNLPNSVYRTLSFVEKDVFASIAAWKITSTAMIIQHLVSTNPVKTREIFLYHIVKLADLPQQAGVDAIMTYYQGKTKFAHNMFLYLRERQIGNGILLEPFHFFKYDISSAKNVSSDVLDIKELEIADYAKVENLVLQERGSLYLNSMSLKAQQINQQELFDIYASAGLSRERKILVAKNKETGAVVATIIINQGPVGLHFSLIENSSELIIDHRLSKEDAQAATEGLLAAACTYYRQCPLGFMPLFIKSEQAFMVENLAVELQRQYNLMICDRANYMNWITYLFNEYEKSLNYNSNSKLSLVS